MKRKLLIKGKRVQDIGYRMFLLNLASEHGLTGFHARNLNKDKVEAFYEGDDEYIRAFESDVKVMMPEGAEVEEIHFEDYDGPVKDIERFRSDFITLQLGKMIDIGVKILEKLDTISEKQDAMLEKQDKMLEKQDAMLEKQDKMLEKQDDTINELEGIRGDLRTMLERRLAKLEKDVMMIKERLGIG